MSDYKFGARVRVKSGFYGGLVGNMVSNYYDAALIKFKTAHGKYEALVDHTDLDPVPDGLFADLDDVGLRREVAVLKNAARQYPTYGEALAEARAELARRGLT